MDAVADKFFERKLGDPSPYEGEKRDIDVLTATERHRLFDLVSRLLEEWPERFVSTASTAGLWQSWALRDDDRPPFAYASMVAERLATPRYSPSRAEVQSAADYLRRRSSGLTTPRFRSHGAKGGRAGAQG